MRTHGVRSGRGQKCTFIPCRSANRFPRPAMAAFPSRGVSIVTETNGDFSVMKSDLRSHPSKTRVAMVIVRRSTLIKPSCPMPLTSAMGRKATLTPDRWSLPRATATILRASWTAERPPPQLSALMGPICCRVSRLEHGKRLAKVLNCNGCHGSKYQGGRFPSKPDWGSIHSANLTLAAQRWSDAELGSIIRTGVRPDKRMLWLMPAQNYQHLTQGDMAALIALLNGLAPQGVTHPAPVFGRGAKEEIAQGGTKPPTQLVPDAKARVPIDLGPSHELGRYIATVTCASCHGFELEGMEGWSPDLIVASAYSPAEFELLLTTGKPNGPRKLTDMADAARKNFVHMTPNERTAVYRYLKARAERPQ